MEISSQLYAWPILISVKATHTESIVKQVLHSAMLHHQDVAMKFVISLLQVNIVTDLINSLPDNSSVNTIQQATIQEAVFSVSAVTSRSGGWWSRHMCFL
jgi:hypothetical protein